MQERKFMFYRFISTNISSYRIQLFRFNLFLGVLYFTDFLLNLILLNHFNLIFFSLTIIFISIAMAISIYKFNRIVISLSRDFSLLLVVLVTSYYGIFSGKETGFFLFFFYVLMVLPYIVNFKTEEKDFLLT